MSRDWPAAAGGQLLCFRWCSREEGVEEFCLWRIHLRLSSGGSVEPVRDVGWALPLPAVIGGGGSV